MEKAEDTYRRRLLHRSRNCMSAGDGHRHPGPCTSIDTGTIGPISQNSGVLPPNSPNGNGDKAKRGGRFATPAKHAQTHLWHRSIRNASLWGP